jgi:hypothetical protein
LTLEGSVLALLLRTQVMKIQSEEFKGQRYGE